MLFVLVVLILAACGGGQAMDTPPETEFFIEEPAAPSMFAMGNDEAQSQSIDSIGFPVSDSTTYELTSPSGDLTILERSNRMIVKNADMRLLVEDTNSAIDRTTQVVSDAGGYIVSSRVWYQDYYEYHLKFASITIGVPVDEFEHVLTRMRGLALEVRDETASGQDVSDQYVDLESQLANLEATRERVASFLDDAKNVDEALLINQQLSDLEAQIEQIKGRMNYLSDRSAFSTITLTLEPEYPEIPVPAKTGWDPGVVFQNALKTLTLAYQDVAEFAIWVGVVILPIFLPPTLFFWFIWKLFTRKTNRPVSGD